MFRIGLDVGSTTVKLVVVDKNEEILFTKYERHNAKAKDVVINILKEIKAQWGDIDVYLRITGSVGMGIAEAYHFPFIQEVVAATKAIQKNYPTAASMIDIGGEDAKVVFFKNGEATDLRMNGNCAGGTGAFIDQMAVILGTNITELNRLALQSTQTYPIASRCGVFCKTDIQNLIAKNVHKSDIAASIFHAVAVQTVVTLAHGYDIQAPVLFCGGPLTFIPALRKAFTDYLGISDADIILPENGTLLPAYGATFIQNVEETSYRLSELISYLSSSPAATSTTKFDLPPIFTDTKTYADWLKRIETHRLPTASFKNGEQEVFIGIDSGSTTTKIVVTDTESRLLYTFYSPNAGTPIETVEKGFSQLKALCAQHHTQLRIKGSCSTGYGEDLIKAAFQLDAGIVETIAHYLAANRLDPEVSFILDIGGQDMKAMFVRNGIMERIEINEACSSGCGSFIETFAQTLGYSAHDFAQSACRSTQPCDLGTRCTVFMNSKVKQVLREGATVDDIAAGLAYSVIKNCLYKVLKLKDVSVLGKHIVVQGGTMRNDAVVRALELLTGTQVIRCDQPELMGAIGCALYAQQHPHEAVSLEAILSQAHYSSRLLRCKGCENQCVVSRYHFDSGKDFYSGNKCEKVFSSGEKRIAGANAYLQKAQLLFGRCRPIGNSTPLPLTIGIPRCLNTYENFPFWHTLFTACGIHVQLSTPSTFKHYEGCAHMVMSDNICFPAKLVHSHIEDLLQKQVDRIFMPYVIFEKQGKETNSYNCPIVTGYSDVIKSVQASNVPIDAPAISFKDRDLLHKACRRYLKSLGIKEKQIDKVFAQALSEQEAYACSLAKINEQIVSDARKAGRLVVMLAGRPYHTDPLIQHQTSDLLANMGIDVITDDIVHGKEIPTDDVHFLAQWAYPNRILKAAHWCVQQAYPIEFVQMTSFGCGPDAFLTDEIRDLLIRHGKSFTLLKLDDINNVGSIKLRIRSLVESIKLSQERSAKSRKVVPFQTTPIYDNRFRQRKIIIPYFTPFISPLLPALVQVAGYDAENLPLSNQESCEWGLKYANNEVCYPATLIVGDLIKAFKSGQYDPAQTAIVLTQTGGQCRASNYITLIKKALIDAGYTDTPVISLALSDTVKNNQPAFQVDWVRMLPIVLRTLLYSDCISKFYHASVVREKEAGQAAQLRDSFLKEGAKLIQAHHSQELYKQLETATEMFNDICTERDVPKVGIVGEIFLKFNPFAHKNIQEWLIERGIEVVPSVLTDFFMQTFVNRKARTGADILRKGWKDLLYQAGYQAIRKQIKKVNSLASQFRYFIPFKDIFEEAEGARNVISLNAQFGEGWLLPAEIIAYAQQGITNVVSLQPFGCIANQIVSKGIEKRIKQLYPHLNLLSLDFDSGVSDVNVINRMLLFVDNLKKEALCV